MSARDNEVLSVLAEKFAYLNRQRVALEAKLAGIKMKIDDLVSSMDYQIKGLKDLPLFKEEVCFQYANFGEEPFSVKYQSDKVHPHIVGEIRIPIDEFISGYEQSIKDDKEQKSQQSRG